ncbi:hypothetical protein RhiJN_10102 [Ceratobasidium sp. AG-Ba]|nr:hypothetical protein RhiJN_10102 [Ceratobasidium sp. AG-Ba]QRW10863.1 hypothetical protein RhiLY_09862 [Ceratobasidium sp. AG-Ba]
MHLFLRLLRAEVNRSYLKTLCGFAFFGQLVFPSPLNPLIVPGLVGSSYTLEEQRCRVRVRVPSQADALGINDPGLTLMEFQILYIKHRIHAHAKRVEDNHIASALLVSKDMEKAMEMA